MAKKEEKAMAEAVPAVPVAPVEDEYSVRELAGASRNVFGVEPECVTAALNGQGQKFTVSAAREMIDQFMKKEVR